MDIVLSANSPGELWGWIRPFATTIRRSLPSANLSLFLFPCQYATGREAQVARDLIGIKTVIPPADSLRYILLARRPKKFSVFNPVLIHFGGDLFFASLLGKKLKATTYSYQWGNKLWDRFIAGYFVSSQRQEELLIQRKIPKSKIMLTGDLIADAIQMELSASKDSDSSFPKQGGYRVGLFPGSREIELKHLLPFYLKIVENTKHRLPETAFHLVLSPFIEDTMVAQAIQSNQNHILESGSGVLEDTPQGKCIRTGGGVVISISRGNQYRIMKESHCILTIPGTKCGEAAMLGVPMLVTLPTNRLEEIPYPGIAGLVEKIPFAGRYGKRVIMKKKLSKFGFVSQPNILAGKEVVPELVGNLTVESVADSLVSLLKDFDRRKTMGITLQEVYQTFKPCAETIISIISEKKAC